MYSVLTNCSSVKASLRCVFKLILHKKDTLHCIDKDMFVCLFEDYCVMHCHAE